MGMEKLRLEIENLDADSQDPEQQGNSKRIKELKMA